jgi:DNA polymerase III sliding clamp (beta) subunit (PCNA family)
MKIVYNPQGSRVNELLRLVSGIMDEVSVVFDLEGMHIRAGDASGVSMVDMDINMCEFISYDLAGQVSLKRRIRLNDLNPVLKRFDKADSVRVEDDVRGMKISTNKKYYIIPVLDEDADGKDTVIPVLEFKSGVLVNAESMVNMVKDAKSINADTVVFCMDKKLFGVSAKSDMMYYTASPTETEYHVMARKEEDSLAKYSLEYLETILTDKLTTEIVVYWSTNYPVSIQYIDEEGYNLAFMLAPRIESND